jgi:hypothetical protein
MKTLIKLTIYDTGKHVYILPSSITAITPLNSYHNDLLGFEGGERTRVDYGRFGSALVKESPEEILDTIKKSQIEVRQ